MRRFACAVIVAVVSTACQGADHRASEPPVWLDYVWAGVMGQDTEYTLGYSDAAFNAIKIGTLEAEVERLLGKPFGETWVYGAFDPYACDWLVFGDDRLDQEFSFMTSCGSIGIRPDMSTAEVRAIKGPPTELYRSYSRSPGDRNYWMRVVATSNGAVTEINRRLYYD